MFLGTLGDWLYTKLTANVIQDQRIVDFIDMAEWISLWLVISVTVISIFGLVAIYAERKVSAHMQSRLGPMRVGPKGLLQTLADGVKLLEKEDIIPKAADPVLFIAAPCFVFASAVAMFAVLPFANFEGKTTVPALSLHHSEVSFEAVDGEYKGMTELQVRKEKHARQNAAAILAQFEDVELTEVAAEGLIKGLSDHQLHFNEILDVSNLSSNQDVLAAYYSASRNPLGLEILGDTPIRNMSEKVGAQFRATLSETYPEAKISAYVDRPWFGTPAYVGAGLFFILAISSISTMGVVLAGWGSNNKWSLYGAIREAAQMVSYEIPMGIAALCVVVACSSLNLMDIAQSQETGTMFGLAPGVHLGFLSWNIIKFPVLFPVFIIFYISVLAHTKRAPFDLPEAESELIAGFMTEYSGMRWSLFFLAEYGEMYALSALTAVLFMGGFATIPILDGVVKSIGPFAWMAYGAAMLVAKTLFLVFVMMWLRWTLPRIRLDQIMYMCLKCLLPFTMVALFLQTLWTLNPVYGVIACAVTGVVVLALMKTGGSKRDNAQAARLANA